jgi:hypothetical protein
MAKLCGSRIVPAITALRRCLHWVPCALLGLALPSNASEPGCRLALALALDISSSVDDREYALLRDGLAAALLSDEVQAQLFAGAPVAITTYEWSSRNRTSQTLRWTLLEDPAALQEAVRRIYASRRVSEIFPTGIGEALGYGSRLMRDAPTCARQVIDVSGDGVHNDGFPPAMAYKYFPFDGITVNGLVIQGADADVLAYYEQEVIRGPGAFIEIAGNYEDFERAMQRKLLREIGALVIGSRMPSEEAEWISRRSAAAKADTE